MPNFWPAVCLPEGEEQEEIKKNKGLVNEVTMLLACF
jgi:hypothetical protein